MRDRPFRRRPRRRPADDAFAADGRSTRWADHREARRAELVRIARRTVHHRGPDVSMEEIAAAAGTSKSIVYRYFADKTGLQIAVAEAVVLQIQGALEGVLRIAPTPRDGLRGDGRGLPRDDRVVAQRLRVRDAQRLGRVGRPARALPRLGHRPGRRPVRPRADRGARRSRTARRPEDAPSDDAALAARVALAESWAAGAVGFVRGAGEWWLAHRDEPGSPDREEITAQVAAWLWAGPVGPARP